MNPDYSVFFLLVIIWAIVAPIVAVVHSWNAKDAAKALSDELEALKIRLRRLETFKEHPQESPPAASTLGGIPEEHTREVSPPDEPEEFGSAPAVEHTPNISPPPLPDQPEVAFSAPAPAPNQAAPAAPRPPVSPAAPPLPSEPFSLEKFMGIKLFAWLGGIAMFFGVVLFVKYAFENNLISPATRIALGFITGGALLAGGFVLHRIHRYQVLAQALCATGILILYGVIFAAHAVYHFEMFDTRRTFVFMALVTALAIATATRLNAIVVVGLGMLGGFITPLLLSSTGENIIFWTGYIALLDVGILWVSRLKGWRKLVPFAAAGTVLIQTAWYFNNFDKGQYDEGSRVLIPMAISFLFIGLFLAAEWLEKAESNTRRVAPVFMLSATAMLFSFILLWTSKVSNNPIQLYGFVFLLQLPILLLVRLRPSVFPSLAITAVLTFLHLSHWANHHLIPASQLLFFAMIGLFTVTHVLIPQMVARRSELQAASATSTGPSRFLPLLLALASIPFWQLSKNAGFPWLPCFILNLSILLAAWISGTMRFMLGTVIAVASLAVLVLFRASPFLDSDREVAGGSVATLMIILWAGAARFIQLPSTTDPKDDRKPFFERLAAATSLLPFMLLVLVSSRTTFANPTELFIPALIAACAISIYAFIKGNTGIIYFALGGMLLVETTWHHGYFNQEHALVTFSWYGGITALFLALPFVLRRISSVSQAPWIAACLAGIGNFFLIHEGMRAAYPNDMMGLLPALFAVPYLLAIPVLIKWFPEMDHLQKSRLAWVGGTALLFITLIFPVQFDTQWLTVGWAMEGAMLIWLYRRVPHAGLKWVGLTLLALAFGRLALNPNVFLTYPRGEMAILNWQLYTFGLVALAIHAGAHWLRSPIAVLRPILYAMEGILLFLLLNLQIADYFTPRGESTIAFQLGGNFARDMTYSIGWGIFALILLIVGFMTGAKLARYIAVGLLAVTLLKVFIYDLASIESVFRIGALIGVAIIAFFASFLYQRFYDRQPKA